MAGASREQRPRVGSLEHADHPGVHVRAQCCSQPAVGEGPDSVAKMGDVRVGADQCDRAGIDERGTAGGKGDHVSDGLLYPLRHGNRFVGADRGERLHPAPQHFGQQMVLGAEVRVGGSWGNAGSPGHTPHGEPVVADRFGLLFGGSDQRHHKLRLAGAQPTTGGFDVDHR